MKKILFATTALVATAGWAAADVTIGGFARFGAQYDSASEDWNTSTRLRFQITASTETDGGVRLSAMQRIQSDRGQGNATNGARFSIGYEGLTVNVGNIVGVIEGTPNLYMPTASAGVGLSGNGFYSLATNTSSNSARFGWTAYDSTGFGQSGNNGIEVMYSIAGVGLHAHSTDDSYGVRAAYTFSGITGAVAYEEFDNDDTYLLVTVGGRIGQINAALGYAQTEIAGVEAEKWSLKGAYDFGTGLTAYAFVASEDNGVGESYGLGASFDLGGGASLEGGWTRAADFGGTGDDEDIVSIGAFFRF